MYSAEDGTPAAKLQNQVDVSTKKKRYNELMKLAKAISEEKLSTYIGNTYKVLIEGKTADNKYYIGRTYMDIPDTDGTVFIKNEKSGLEESFVDCKIIESKNYDLIAKVV